MDRMDRVDVFVRIHAVLPQGKFNLRRGMWIAVIARWLMMDGIRLTIIHTRGFMDFPPCFGADATSLEPRGFHMGSKRMAEGLATSPVYVVADDDCLPIGKGFIRDGIRQMELNPGYALVGASSISDGVHADLLDTPAAGVVPETAAGGIVFVKRGVLKEFKDCDADQVDDVIAQEVKTRRHKVGLMPHVLFNHLGAGFSVTSRSAGNWRA